MMTPQEIQEFKRRLYEGPVEFTFFKILKDSKGRPVKDDEGRPVFDEANPESVRGTMKPDLLPVRKQLQDRPEDAQGAAVQAAADKVKAARKMPADSIIFWNLEKQGFRTVKEAGLVEFH